VKHFLLFYDVVGDYVSRRAAFRDGHLEKAWTAAAQGEFVLGGALADPGTVRCFSSRETRGRWRKRSPRPTPYVVNGLVTRWRVREWTTVVGDQAVSPARPNQG
jgi:uncharacterized protein